MKYLCPNTAASAGQSPVGAVIVKVDHTTINESGDLARFTQGSQPTQTIRVTYYDGRILVIALVPLAMPEFDGVEVRREPFEEQRLPLLETPSEETEVDTKTGKDHKVHELTFAELNVPDVLKTPPSLPTDREPLANPRIKQTIQDIRADVKGLRQSLDRLQAQVDKLETSRAD